MTRDIAQPEGTVITTIREFMEIEFNPDFVLVADSWAEYSPDDFDDDETLYVFSECEPADDEPEMSPDYPRRLSAIPLTSDGYRDPLNEIIFAG